MEAASLEGLPKTEVYWSDKPSTVEGYDLEFRLIYEGVLPSEANHPRTEEKQAIRRALHPQLRELWKQDPFLRIRAGIGPEAPSGQAAAFQTYADGFKQISKNNHVYRFAPLIGEMNSLVCSLEILFLRRDAPGSLVTHCGDIDNRLKVLLDGLRMPRESKELEDRQPTEDENPFFCLLEDDKYIDRLAITTDRLLQPTKSQHDVVLMIHVSTRLYGITKANFWW